MKKFTSQEIEEFVSKLLFDEEVILSKNPSWPKISIVTPSYNQAKFLERAILSVLNQNYPNLEYIIIDGGSTDGSVEIIKKYEKYLTFWVSEKDKGQSDAINKGFRKTSGELVGWQNSDDIYLPGAFMKLAEKYKKNPDYDVYFGNIYLIDKYDNIKKEMRFIPFSVEHLIYYDWNLSSQAVFWKKEIFKKVGFLDESLHVAFDWDWFIRLGKLGYSFKFVRCFLGCYRVHDMSKLATVKGNERCECIARVREKNKILAESKGMLSLKKMKIFLRRIIYYLIQGDYQYLYEGILGRLKKINKVINY